jgi:ribonuclease HI
VRLQYVKGHSGDTGNDGADRQANLGALKPPENEQDWAQLEAELKQRLEVELGGSDQAKPVPLEIGDEQDNIALPDLGESPTKIRKIVSVTDKPNSKAAVEPLKPSSHSAPQVPLSPVPPSASTSVSEISAKVS